MQTLTGTSGDVHRQTEEMSAVFGSKKRREKRESEVRKAVAHELSQRSSLPEALQEVAASKSDITLRVGYIKIHGNHKGFSVNYKGIDRYGRGHLTNTASSLFDQAKSQLGRRYRYQIVLTGSRQAHTISSVLAPGWRDYARPMVNEWQHFGSVRAFEAWLGTSNGRDTRIRDCYISVSRIV